MPCFREPCGERRLLPISVMLTLRAQECLAYCSRISLLGCRNTGRLTVSRQSFSLISQVLRVYLYLGFVVSLLLLD